ncbi:DUF2905 domain-containing protein [Spectribacter hydrogenoxidans]|uniref:DUF2905 domain-containing protein n=1 Tax=Spectribacter hydrogenoxidans TaxID=3075608 RepID=A0ABU3BZJ1_9GAMM|nr:DUF2905 domain-containing protein [Salinisphaera sp. W335]MDT0634723.1 DUF2905 domain-containing protein [Salinisphaera sp. W335]
MQKVILVTGLLIMIAGLLWPWLSRLPLGRLPGDLVFGSGNTRIHIPLTTMLLVSVLVSLLLWLWRR